MLKYIVVIVGDICHICYEIPGTGVYHSYETATSKFNANVRAAELNHLCAVKDISAPEEK